MGEWIFRGFQAIVSSGTLLNLVGVAENLPTMELTLKGAQVKRSAGVKSLLKGRQNVDSCYL